MPVLGGKPTVVKPAKKKWTRESSSINMLEGSPTMVSHRAPALLLIEEENQDAAQRLSLNIQNRFPSGNDTQRCITNALDPESATDIGKNQAEQEL
ncbi:hypothetical protein R1flu_013359 [Riccia fluitans]|uniref:Uncharacterized protein n=1 Tax=Riccia fluitans TaxID=41844 RepID=A0ABD1YDB8_9MARC